MAYDPHRNRDQDRQHPDQEETSEVDALPDAEEPDGPAVNDDTAQQPPPQPSVTPTPADPWSDGQIYSTATVSTVVCAVIGLLILRWLWKRYKKRHR